MTQPPIVPGQAGIQYWPPATVPPKKSRLPWLIAAGALGVVLVVALAVVFVLQQGEPASPKAPSAWDQEQAGKAGAGATTQAPAPSATPQAADFKLTAKITRKNCFGSAGCNIDFKVDMEYSGPTLSEGDTWEITYEVTGVEDGPMIGTLELTGTTFTASEESVGTNSSKAKLVIKVTDIDKVGI